MGKHPTATDASVVRVCSMHMTKQLMLRCWVVLETTRLPLVFGGTCGGMGRFKIWVCVMPMVKDSSDLQAMRMLPYRKYADRDDRVIRRCS